MPYFVDPGREVVIKNLTSKPDKYPPISAYEYLKWRLAQSYVDNDYAGNDQVEKEGLQHIPEKSEYSAPLIMEFFIQILIAAVGMGTPLLFATLGGVISERAGVINLGMLHATVLKVKEIKN